MAHNPNGSETKSTLACFIKPAKCMTLSVLETSLPMQRSHDTLHFCLKLVCRAKSNPRLDLHSHQEIGISESRSDPL